MPHISIDTDKYSSQREYLMALINQEAKLQYGDQYNEVVIARINKEFLMLNDWNVNYLLVLYEILHPRTEDEILFYTARGTAAGSIICYCLGFTHVDPINNGLHFDRMLPDYESHLGIDFEMGFRTRDIVVKRMIELFGEECVSLINGHVCAVIADARPISEHTPTHSMIQKGVGKIQVTDNPFEELEKLPYKWTRFNFIALGSLSVIEATLHKIKEVHGKTIKIDDLPIESLSFSKFPRKRELIKLAISIDYSPLRILLKIDNPSITDLVAIYSLYRPGVLDNLQNYIDRRNGLESWEDKWVDPRIKEILNISEGILIFQEQLMSIYPNESNRAALCYAMRNKQLTDTWHETFLHEMSIAGYPSSDISQLWEIITNEGPYIFNKSHTLIRTQGFCFGARLFKSYYDCFMESYKEEEDKDGRRTFKEHDWKFSE